MDSDEQFTNSQLMAEQQRNAIAKANGNSSKNGIVGRDSGVGEAVASVGEQRSDVSRLHTCTECLLEQPTPYRAQLHYHRVHKRGNRPLLDNKHGLNVCNICEQVIDAKAMTAHIARHQADKSEQLVLPYYCRFRAGVKCQFRTSNRSALLRHFCTKHVGTHVLLCPFCLLTFSVPSAEKCRKLVRMHDFVKHMTYHDGDKSLYCSLCVTRVPFSLHQQMKTHQEQHGKHKDDQKKLQWQMQTLDLKELNAAVPDKSRAFVTADMSIAQCVECGQMEPNLSTHFGKERRRCNFCAFATRCSLAMGRHCLLAQCNESNVARTPFAGWTSSVSVAPLKLDCFSASSSSSPSLPLSSSSLFQFACTFCDTFYSVNVQVLADHLDKVHERPCSGVNVRLLRHPNNTSKSNNNGTFSNNKRERESQKKANNNTKGEGEEQQQQLKVDEQLKQYTMDQIKEKMHEADLFGLRRMGDAPLEKEKEETNANDDGQKRQSPETAATNATWMTSEQAAMHDWRSLSCRCSMPTLIHCATNRPEQARLFNTMKAQDEDGDNGMGATSAEEEMNGHRVRMGLMHDF